MSELIADRFISSGGWQLDLARGAPVSLRLLAAGTSTHQAVWSDSCATLARLRHPLLNALVDYGAADRYRLFEAYEITPPLKGAGIPASRLIAHVTRFLESHAVPLGRGCGEMRGSRGRPRTRTPRAPGRNRIATAPRARRDHRRAPRRSTGRRREHRGPRDRGQRDPHAVGPRGSRSPARRLRSRFGKSPRAAALARGGAARTTCRAIRRERNAQPVRAVAAFIARLGAASSRRHVLIKFGRAEPRPGALQVDRMGGTTMQAMLYRDRDEGPCLEEVLGGIQAADGHPGALVEWLRAIPLGHKGRATSLVRESSPEYLATSAAPERPLAQRRVSAALHGAAARAERLASRGRHAGAIRALDRAIRVLEGRVRPSDAARCALTLGWILRDRGRNAEAEKQFEHARTLTPDSLEGIQASIAIGIVWTDDDRLMDAEALLRSAHSAAGLLEERETERAAALALGRCLLWRGRIDEAGAVVAPHTLERCSGVRMGARSAHPPGGRRGGARRPRRIPGARVCGNVEIMARRCRRFASDDARSSRGRRPPRLAPVGRRGSGSGVCEPSAAHFPPAAGGMAFRASERYPCPWRHQSSGA